jgi:hypothetical protein
MPRAFIEPRRHALASSSYGGHRSALILNQYHPAIDSSAAAWCDRFSVIFIERDRLSAST